MQVGFATGSPLHVRQWLVLVRIHIPNDENGDHLVLPNQFVEVVHLVAGGRILPLQQVLMVRMIVLADRDLPQAIRAYLGPPGIALFGIRESGWGFWGRSRS